MKIVSWNVNGLRAVYKRNFLDWFLSEDAEFVCLQEVKAWEDQLPAELSDVEGYYSFFNTASKKGYSGVVVYCKKEPRSVEMNLGIEKFDSEGRYLELRYDDFSLVNLYIPHGGRDKSKLVYKLEVYSRLLERFTKRRSEKLILIGDFNIAHEDVDLARPKQNRDNIMFTSGEREQIDKLIDSGFVDSFRKFNKQNGNYTWWPYSYNARERNLGWRIDYCFASRSIKERLSDAFIRSGVGGSDHCPVGVKLF